VFAFHRVPSTTFQLPIYTDSQTTSNTSSDHKKCNVFNLCSSSLTANTVHQTLCKCKIKTTETLCTTQHCPLPKVHLTHDILGVNQNPIFRWLVIILTSFLYC
jgi:hypothetical protein